MILKPCFSYFLSLFTNNIIKSSKSKINFKSKKIDLCINTYFNKNNLIISNIKVIICTI